MEQFLNSIAHYYYQQYKTKLNKICFVFPGRRAGLFFQKYLAEIIKLNNDAIFLPEIKSLEAFCEELSGLETADNLQLIFDLYDVYKSNPLNTASFDVFYQIGDTLLADFDDIDKYLVNAKDLFTNIQDINDLTDTNYSYLSDNQKETIANFWKNFNPKVTTNNNEQDAISFNSIFTQLPNLYADFRKKLIEENIGYEGLIQREIAKKIISKDGLEIKSQKLVFIGFNALNKCEIKLFEYLKNQGVAEFFWDYSPYLINSGNIGGKYIVENLETFPAPENWDIPQYESGKKPNISITAVASNATQTQIVNYELEKIAKAEKNDPIEIGVILADENLLLPTLYSIPEAFDKINITMGYPLKNSSITALISQLILLNKNKQVSSTDTTYYYKNILPIFDHQLFASFDEIKVVQEIKNKILKENIIRVSKKFLLAETEKDDKNSSATLFIRMILNSDNLPISEYLLNLLNFLYQVEEKLPKLDKEFIYHHFKAINRINGILQTKEIAIDDTTWLRIYNKITQRISVPFAGEPLQGVQVMGIMETRALDFKNLVILSLNENVFPKSSRPNSFILYNLRKGYAMPTVEHRDSIFAYYFFRLISRAENVNLVYSTASSESSANEMSRFLYQIKYQFSDVTYKVGIETLPKHDTEHTITIMKDEVTKKLINNHLESDKFEIYPTSLEKYFQCKLSYYFSSILKLQEIDDVTEEFDNRIIGLIFHKAMELLYENNQNEEISEEVLKQIWSKPNQKKALEGAFEQIKKENKLLSEDTGYKMLIFNVLEKYLSGFYNLEKQRVPFSILCLEKKYTFEIKLSTGKSLKIGGNIDRTDMKDGVIQVIDYKTGEAQHRVSEIEDLFAKKFDSRNKSVLQTLLYCMIYAHQAETQKLPIQPCVVQVKKIFDPKSNFALKYYRTKSKKNNFNETEERTDEIFYSGSLQQGINEIFDRDILKVLDEIFVSDTPFTQTDDVKTCSYCRYKSICLR